MGQQRRLLPIGILQRHRGKWNSVWRGGDWPNQLISQSWKVRTDIWGNKDVGVGGGGGTEEDAVTPEKEEECISGERVSKGVQKANRREVKWSGRGGEQQGERDSSLTVSN